MASEANALSPELRGRGPLGSANSDDLDGRPNLAGGPNVHTVGTGRIGRHGSPVVIAVGWATMTGVANPLSIVSELLAPVFAEIAGRPDVDPVVRPSDRADAQVNGALPLAKQIGSNPREIAQRVLDSGVFADVCSEVEIAGPGFINLTFADSFLSEQLEAVAVDDRLGIAPATKVRTVVVDYSAPNVAKEMHVGHLRSTVIGDALVRMHEFAGHRVIRENHIGDWGRPFGMLIEHLLDLGEDVAAEGLGQGDLDGFYKQANAKFTESVEFQVRARERVVMLQGDDPDTIKLWQRLVEMSNDYFTRSTPSSACC